VRIVTRAVPVAGWGSEREWLAARRTGLGASEAAAALGFVRYRTPWQVWAEKTDTRRPPELGSPAGELGHALEPWLLQQAATMLGRPVARTPARLYAHPGHPWRLASPDAMCGAALVEAKTAGLVSGWPVRGDWTEDRIPLGYELQVRWQMHVMGAPAVEVVALVAGVGLRRWSVQRDPGIEAELVAQVAQWWQTHVVGGLEPPLGPYDRPTAEQRWPAATAGPLDLDGTELGELIARRQQAAEREEVAGLEREECDNRVRALLGEHREGWLDGQWAVRWSDRRGRVDWRSVALALAWVYGLDLPGEQELERHRYAGSRVLTYRKPKEQ
jgi:putative phage-type endonuclease